MTEEKAPSPLPETLPIGARYDCRDGYSGNFPNGATLCHGRYEGTIHRDDGSSSEYGCVRAEYIDWSSVAALRTPPSPPSEGPRVGEKWLAAVWTDGVMTKERPVTITRLGETCADIEGGENYSARLPGHYLNRNWCLVRRLSAPSADKWEPAVGDEVEGIGIVSGEMRRGKVLIVATEWDGQPALKIEGCYFLHPGTVRPATPSPKVEEATLPPCQHRNVNLYTMRCDDCGMTAAQVRAKAEKVAERVDPPAAKLDPDGRYPNTGFPSALDIEKHAVARDRDIAAIKQHLADFDRKVKPRHPSDWLVDDAPELYST